MEAVQQKIAWY